MRLGFIGTGAITTAIVTGLCTSPHPPEAIWVSPRNRDNADRLASEFDRVWVGPSNQEVVDNSDGVFLAILPRQRETILPGLAFRKEQLIVHLLAGIAIEQVKPLVAPASCVVRAVPLPCTAIHTGPIAICPDHDTISRIFDPLGTVIAMEEESQLETLAVITALMAPYYHMVDRVARWGSEQGIDMEKVTAFTASMFEALSRVARDTDRGDVAGLVTECMTPGGLNEQAMDVINAHGGFSNITTALEAVKNR